MLNLVNLGIGLVLGFMLANNMSKPVHNAQNNSVPAIVTAQNSLGPREQIVQPVQIDPREVQFMQDCKGYGFPKDQCVAIWHDKNQ